MDLWNHCKGKDAICLLSTTAFRVVEAQHLSSTRKLVDNAKEHEILEQLLDEQAKPRTPDAKGFDGLHYLLSTPFRYPPLKYGSRFGRRFERSIWYGSLNLHGALAEVAFYRLKFYEDTHAPLTATSLSLTAYQVKIDTPHGVHLDKPLFNQYKEDISNPASYAISQPLGSEMRAQKTTAFVYHSARSANQLNMGVFSPIAFPDKKPIPHSLQTWTCYNDGKQVEFMRETGMGTIKREVFQREAFLIDGVLPFDQT